MANKKIKHIVAKLLGATTEETLDIYDESALHATDIVDNLTSNDATKVLSAKQGKALNDSITNVQNITSSVTITATVGTVTEYAAYKFGRIVQLYFSGRPVAVSEGMEAFKASISGYRPVQGVSFANSYGKAVYVTRIDRGGTIITYPLNAASEATHMVYGSFVYIANT